MEKCSWDDQHMCHAPVERTPGQVWICECGKKWWCHPASEKPRGMSDRIWDEYAADWWSGTS